MILAAIKDPFLLNSVRRAALPAEDVFSEMDDVLAALQCGFPRLSVLERGGDVSVERAIKAYGPELPVLELTPLDLPGIRHSASAIAIQRIDTAPVRMRQLINEAALRRDWVEGLLRDLSRAAGHPLPVALNALGRRTLECRPGTASSTRWPLRWASRPGRSKHVFGAAICRRRLPTPRG